MKFEITTYVVGNLIPKLKKDVSALFDIHYYHCAGIDVGDNDDDNFAKFDNGTKGLGHKYNDDKDNNMNIMNIHMNMNIHSYKNHSHHNNHRSNKCLT